MSDQYIWLDEPTNLPLWTKEKEEYCTAWAHNASHYQGQGCYSWMAERLRPLQPQRILDIGCGTGEGLLALAQAFSPQIVCLEENAKCITQCAAKLSDAGIEADAVLRMGYIEHPDGSHDMVLDEEEIEQRRQVTLVHTEVLCDDPVVSKHLAAAPKFDAVTVWLMGAYKLRASSRALANYKIANPDEYRLRVENKAHELADRLLRKGGVATRRDAMRGAGRV